MGWSKQGDKRGASLVLLISGGGRRRPPPAAPPPPRFSGPNYFQGSQLSGRKAMHPLPLLPHPTPPHGRQLFLESSQSLQNLRVSQRVVSEEEFRRDPALKSVLDATCAGPFPPPRPRPRREMGFSGGDKRPWAGNGEPRRASSREAFSLGL